MHWLFVLFFVLSPSLVLADADRIVGVDSTTGQETALTGDEAANIIGVAGDLDAITQVGNTSTGNDETNPLEVFGSGGQAAYGWQGDQTSSGEARWRCKTAAGVNKCDYYRQVDDTYEGGFKDKDGTKRFTMSGTSGALTNMTVDAEATGNNFTIPFEWDLDLCAINPSDSSLSHVWNKDPLATAPTLTAKAGTNRSTCVLTFPDSNGQYGVAITRRLPTGWTGSFDADIWWDTTGTGNARFQFQTKCYADDAADDASFNTASVVTAAPGTSGRPNLQTITGITTTGCSAGNLMRIRFYRDRTEASDALNAALNVEKVIFIGRATR